MSNFFCSFFTWISSRVLLPRRNQKSMRFVLAGIAHVDRVWIEEMSISPLCCASPFSGYILLCGFLSLAVSCYGSSSSSSLSLWLVPVWLTLVLASSFSDYFLLWLAIPLSLASSLSLAISLLRLPDYLAIPSGLAISLPG